MNLVVVIFILCSSVVYSTSLDTSDSKMASADISGTIYINIPSLKEQGIEPDINFGNDVEHAILTDGPYNDAFQSVQITSNYPTALSINSKECISHDYPCSIFAPLPNTEVWFNHLILDGLTSHIVEIQFSAHIDYNVAFSKDLPDSGSLGSNVIIILDDKIKSTADKITSSTTNDYEKTKLLTRWVFERMTYDERVPHGRASNQVLQDMSGACDDYAKLLTALLRSEGIHSRLISGYAYNGKFWDTHGWVEAYVDDQWIPLDPTFGEVKYLDAGHVAFFRSNSDQTFIVQGGLFLLERSKESFSSKNVVMFSAIPDDWSIQSETAKGVPSPDETSGPSQIDGVDITINPIKTRTTDCKTYKSKIESCNRDKTACETAKASGLDVQDCNTEYNKCIQELKTQFASCVPTGVYKPIPEEVEYTTVQTHIVDAVRFNKDVNNLDEPGIVYLTVKSDKREISTSIGVIIALDGSRRYTLDGVHYYPNIEELTNPSVKQRLERWYSDFGEFLWAKSMRSKSEFSLADMIADNSLQDFRSSTKDGGYGSKILDWAIDKTPTGGQYAVNSITTMFSELNAHKFRETFKRYAEMRNTGKTAADILKDQQDPLGEMQVLLHVGQGNPFSNKQIFLGIMENTYGRYSLAKNQFGRVS